MCRELGCVGTKVEPNISHNPWAKELAGRDELEPSTPRFLSSLRESLTFPTTSCVGVASAQEAFDVEQQWRPVHIPSPIEHTREPVALNYRFEVEERECGCSSFTVGKAGFLTLWPLRTRAQ